MLKLTSTITLWAGIGSLAVGGATADPADRPSGKELGAPILLAAGGEGGEGGEGSEGGGALTSYKLRSTDPNAWNYDGAAQVDSYAALVHASYGEALEEARRMRSAIEAFLDDPNPATLARARDAWINARPAYLRTEAFRFYDGPIDFANPETGEEGPEGRINAWPLNESFIDYVEGNPGAGIVNNPEVDISRAVILEKDQVTDEADVTTGWHAVEFLLWGQDLSLDGPGQRPHTDYLPGEADNDRRREYLRIVTDQLVTDLDWLQAQWAPGHNNYRARFEAMDQREAIGRIMNGLAVLAGFEMASERLAVALDSGDQEDEHSCFSDTTHRDHIYDLRGIRNVWYGNGAGHSGPGMAELLRELDPGLAAQVEDRLDKAAAALADIDQPFDRVLASAPGSDKRREAEAAVTALQELAVSLKEAGQRMGVLVIIGG